MTGVQTCALPIWFHSGSLPALFVLDLFIFDLFIFDLFKLGLFISDLAADLLMFDLRRADVEREVILFRTCVQPERTEKFKSALIGIGESAPIRDR